MKLVGRFLPSTPPGQVERTMLRIRSLLMTPLGVLRLQELLIPILNALVSTVSNRTYADGNGNGNGTYRIVSDHRELCESLGGRSWFSGILGDRLGFPTGQELPGNGPVQHIQPGASLRLREFRYKGAKKLKLVRSPGSWSTHGG